MIEEDIHNDDKPSTPLINAHTKQQTGKAKALYPTQVPPFFQSTDLDRNRDTIAGLNAPKSPISGKPFVSGLTKKLKMRDSPSPMGGATIEEDLRPHEQEKQTSRIADNPS